METSQNRRLAAIMFTDIVGYTALMQQNEQLAVGVRKYHRQTFEDQHKKYQGEIIQYFGDGTLSVFQSGVEAVACAIEIQKVLQKYERPIGLRIGIHIGDIVFDGTEIYGDGVNLAARIESLSVAGAILISENLNTELKNHPSISTKSLGEFELKNIQYPVEVFAIDNEGIVSPKRTELRGKGKELNKTIAVLPFVNMSSSEDNEYFSDGMTEEIINALAKIKGLKVTSRTSSFFFKNKNIPIHQIGKELNVSTILEGSIRLAGNKMRITAQLIDVKDDFHFWSETFDRSIDDIFAVQDEISLLIADKLREHIGHFDIDEKLVVAPDITVDTYKDYLKSRYHILKMNRSDIDEGIHLLENILEVQPDFALGYLGLHLAYTLMGTIGLMPAGEAFIKGKKYLEKALEIDPNLPDGHLQQSYICFLEDWDFERAYAHLQKAFELRPSVEYYQSMASMLVAEAKYEAALNYINIGIQLDPFANINYHLKGYIFYCQEKYKNAQENFEKGLELNPTFMASTIYLGQTLLLAGKEKEGLAFFQGLPEDNQDLMKLGGTTLAYAMLNETDKAEQGIQELEKYLETDLLERAINMLINCYSVLGQHEKALALIDQGVAYRLPMFVYLFVEPLLKPLRHLPKLKALAKEIIGENNLLNLTSRKYKKTLFSEGELRSYKHQLEELMKRENPYLEPTLTLRSLAEMMSIPPNHLSQLLNEGFNKNFAEFVNAYRLEAFKVKVADPSLSHLTILALAYESGFNSKTVFNTFFKKTMGKTPRAYWKEVKEENA